MPSEAKAVKTECLHAASRLKAVLEAVEEIIFFKDRQGRYTLINGRFLKAFGKSEEEIIGKKDEDIFSKKEAAMLCTEDREIFETGKKLQREHRLKVQGKERIFRTTKVPLRDPEGNITELCGFAQDITEQKRTEAEYKQMDTQMHQARKMESIGRLASGIAHGFNNLLTTILGNARLALADLDRQSPVYEYIEEIIHAGERAAELVREILAFSRKEETHPQLLDLNEEIRALSEWLRNMLKEDIQLQVCLEARSPQVYLDPLQLKQVLLNLAVNASDAMPQGGLLTIKTGDVRPDEKFFRDHGITRMQMKPGAYVMLRVSDTGCGMDEDIRARMFDPFFTTKQVGAGTGLGLAVVYGIVKQNNGFIFSSSKVGRGTTISIYFPLASEAVKRVEAERVPAVEAAETTTILITEDNEEVRKITRKILERKGYRVLDAADGEEALRITGNFKEPIHLLLTDMVMPKMSGEELANRMRSIWPELKVLFMSGYAEQAVLDRISAEKKGNFIWKPFTPETLIKKVKETLQFLSIRYLDKENLSS
ncbi:MAG: PAS domain-containing protein [Deltaproteobacteria bacterium]|nr:PAS domain-containing protein [Deltaproteobacteria bacterium]